MTSTFRATPASSSPVPRPAVSDGSRPEKALNSAAAEVELPIPISPAPRISACAAYANPASRACSASARVMAGSRVKLRVGLPTPMSTITGSIANVAAQYVDRGAAGSEIRDHLAGDFGRIGADAFFDDAVIGAEYHHRFAGDSRHSVDWIRPTWTTSSSSRPRLPGGLVSESRRARMRASSRGVGDGADRIRGHRFEAREKNQDEDFEHLLGRAEAIAVDAADASVEISRAPRTIRYAPAMIEYAGAPAE